VAHGGGTAPGENPSVEIVRHTVIRRPVEEVFAFVADPCNDPTWCKKVVSVTQVSGDGPGPGARYAVVHRPIPLRPPRDLDHQCKASDPPRRIEWREDDGTDVFDVVYELEPDGDATRFTQRSRAQLGTPRFARPIIRHGIGRDIAHQLRALRRVLETPD
jgi:hypothetical protein